MLDWIGSLRVREFSERRVVLTLSYSTKAFGFLIAVLGLYLTLLALPVSNWLAAGPIGITIVGVLLLSLRRRLIFDREAGVLRVDQSAFGLASRSIVPLFHLRAVVVMARDDARRFSPRSSSRSHHYVAYVERRIGDAIYLDESKRCASLMQLAEMIAEVAELRLEYDATSRA